MQIPYQKTVAALEWSLEESVIHLLRTRALRLSEQDLLQLLSTGSWADFDDGELLHLMRRQYNGERTSSEDDVSLDHLGAVLKRSPAKMVYEWECLLDIGSDTQETKEELLVYKIRDAARELGLDPRRFKIWKAPFKLSKAGPILQRTSIDRSDYSDEEEQQLIQILGKGEATARPLIDLPNAVSHHLAKLRYKVLRVYYLPAGQEGIDVKSELRSRLAD